MYIYSSMLFREIAGQEEIKERLIQTVKENRVSHAQLFITREGAGGLPMAMAYAQYLACENPGHSDSCNECSSCIKANKLVHPDIHYVVPVTTKPGENPVTDDFIFKWRPAFIENPYLNLL